MNLAHINYGQKYPLLIARLTKYGIKLETNDNTTVTIRLIYKINIFY